MKREEYKKYLILITYTLLLGFILINIRHIGSFLWNIIVMLTPLWIGIALAFILNVPMSIIEKKVFGKTSKRVRVVSLILSILMVMLLLTILFAWVIPDFINSTTYLVGQIPTLINSLNGVLINMFKNTDLSIYLSNFSGSSEVAEIISGLFKGIINNFSSILSNLATFVVNLIAGIIIAVYFLLEKEKFLKSCSNFIERIFETKIVTKINKILKLANKSFYNFITFQCVECLILGVLMFITFTIFRFPYALTIAFLTTVTAIIPIFGATVACIIGAILIGTTSIKQAIIFLIVFQVIQQIEGNLIYPRVVGKKVGLPPILTIIALMIGGKIAGFFGMLICIPLTSIMYSLIKTAWEKDNIIKIKVIDIKHKNQ